MNHYRHQNRNHVEEQRESNNIPKNSDENRVEGSKLDTAATSIFSAGLAVAHVVAT
jgi:hypothetical protein